MHKLKENAEKELREIEEKGLRTQNIDNAYKLVEIIKGIDKIHMLEDGEYSNARDGRRGNWDYSIKGSSYDSYDDDSSGRRGRSQTTGRYMHRPEYSRLSGDDMEMERYRDRKREYSNTRESGAKREMLDALEDYMRSTTNMLMQLFMDANCEEEREIIMRYAKDLVNRYSR